MIDTIGAVWTYTVPSAAIAPASKWLAVAAGTAPSGRDTYYALPVSPTTLVAPTNSNLLFRMACDSSGIWTWLYTNGATTSGFGPTPSVNHQSANLTGLNCIHAFDFDERGIQFSSAFFRPTPIHQFTNLAGFTGYWKNVAAPNEIVGLIGSGAGGPSVNFFFDGTPSDMATVQAFSFPTGQFLSNIQTIVPTNLTSSATATFALTSWDSLQTSTTVSAPSTSYGLVYPGFDTSSVVPTNYTQTILYTLLVGGPLVIVNDQSTGAPDYPTISAFAAGGTLPEAPTNFVVTSPDSGLIMATWTAPSATPSPALTGYTVTVNDRLSLLATTTVSGTTLTCTLSGVTLAINVTVQIVATNLIGNSPAVTGTVLVADYTVAPVAPKLSSASAIVEAGVPTVQVDFVPVSAAASYIATFTPENSAYIAVNATNSTTPITLAQSTLITGANYSVTVLAKNSIGSSPLSNSIKSFSVASGQAVPAASSNLVLTVAEVGVALAVVALVYYFFIRPRL